MMPDLYIEFRVQKKKGCRRNISEMLGNTKWNSVWNTWGGFQTGVNY